MKKTINALAILVIVAIGTYYLVFNNNYNFPDSASYILDSYIDNGWYFVAMKINPQSLEWKDVPQQLREGHATPVVLKFKTDKIMMGNEKQACQSLIVPLIRDLLCWNVDGCCFDFEETRMEKSLTGQLSWNEPKTYVTITPNELYGAKKVTFYILSYDLQSVPEKEHYRVMEDLQVTGQLGNWSNILRPKLEPKFS